eukprot:5742778-Prorocentrum_lima.AAC.1
MKQFLHLQGTTLKPGQKSDQKDPKKRPNGLTLEAQQFSEREWSKCTKEQVLNQLEALPRKKLVPHAKTRFNIIPSQGQDVK